MKATYTRIQARKILISFLVFAILLTLGALFVSRDITQRLAGFSRLATAIGGYRSAPGQVLLTLQEAENEFQESIVTGNINRNSGYKEKVFNAFTQIDRILERYPDTAHISDAKSGKIKKLYRKKIELSDQLSQLRRDFDSLITAYAEFKGEAERSQAPVKVTLRNYNTLKGRSDTIKKGGDVEKKRLLGRIRDAIVNKNSGQDPGVVEVNNEKITVIDRTIQRAAASDKRTYENKFREIQARNVKLLNMQKQLMVLNTRITNELREIVNEVKDINYDLSSEMKDLSLRNYEHTAALLNRFLLLALLLILGLATILIVFIMQLNNSEVLLRKENERSVALAEQKMDLLLHLSHEIRNPLSAIKWVLNVFRQTELTERQAEMVDSISQASKTLLQTLNDTLDAAKMENSELVTNDEPFEPEVALRAVIEGMEFSAAKKNLSIVFTFKGKEGAIVVGDSLRLKQILGNLLSNAIKFTTTGQITVNAELSSADHRLSIEVIDTGAGISPAQQVKLFSKYYQTNSSKGQGGTGLGLYICKKLVEMQGGKITVKSKLDEGSTFSFYIPYRKADLSLARASTEEHRPAVLDGITVLAVDDNEINLLLMKMLLSNWRIGFVQASNGKEALEILRESDIDVVITDINMPEIDGLELLAAIRKSAPPVRDIPVIAVTDAVALSKLEKYKKLGFSGTISKPFSKAELEAQLVRVVKGADGGRGI